MDQKNISQEVILEFIEGSERAFAEIYRIYYRKVLQFALRSFHEEQIAQDFTQDLFIRVWQKRDRFTGVENFNAYLYGMAWKLASDWHSKAAGRQRILQRYFSEAPQPVHNDLDYQFTEKDYQHMIDRALATTPARGQEIYKLREQGLSRTEIAKQLRLAQHTVDNDLSSAVRAIRSYIKTHAVSIVLLLSAGHVL